MDDLKKNTATKIVNSNPEVWLKNILEKRQSIITNPTLFESDRKLIQQALSLANLFGADKKNPFGESCLAQGLVMAEILNGINADANTLAAALLYGTVKFTDLKIDDVNEQLGIGQKVTQLIAGARRMDSISELYKGIVSRERYLQHNIDNIRKMFLAMVEDIRIVLIKLAERLYILRRAVNFSEIEKQKVAKETMEIYAPLANRLGMIRIKWELEDLSFRFLNPVEYEKIAYSLKQTKNEREHYVNSVIGIIKNILDGAGVKNYQVSGRAKHIYSIYRKMTRKHVASVEGIYDVSAIRIVVPTIEDCYHALSGVHAKWEHIPKEFDDYISAPKVNGYRSIHTAVIGPKNKNVEIQIRTLEMHNQAELGVAAHWIYKEGSAKQSNYEDKIAWLRRLMDWQHEVVGEQQEQPNDIRQIFGDRVYVLTPTGDILELQSGSTPLDFAYHIHSEIGHRCVGAKVNGNIVPLTYQLQTGEYVEILTSKIIHPSRDWINPNLGFLHTAHARAKVLGFFRKQDMEANLTRGIELFDKEVRKINAKIDIDSDLLQKLHFKTKNDLLAALGSGEYKFGNILSALQIRIESEKDKIAADLAVQEAIAHAAKTKRARLSGDIQIHGIDNLLTNIANCCKPIPGDKIIGYVTQNQGISIHRDDCHNIICAQRERPERLMLVSWGETTAKKYPVDIKIDAFDRHGLLRDITNVIANEDIMVLGLNVFTDTKEHVAHINITVEIEGIEILDYLLAKILQLPSVLEAKRDTSK